MKRIQIFSIFLFLSLGVSSSPILVTSTCFGGNGDDRIMDVAYGPDGTLVVAGYSNSDIWSLPPGTQTYVLGADAADPSVFTIFVARFTNDAKQLLSSTRFAYESLTLML